MVPKMRVARKQERVEVRRRCLRSERPAVKKDLLVLRSFNRQNRTSSASISRKVNKTVSSIGQALNIAGEDGGRHGGQFGDGRGQSCSRTDVRGTYLTFEATLAALDAASRPINQSISCSLMERSWRDVWGVDRK